MSAATERPALDQDSIHRRKTEHVALAVEADVGFQRTTTLLEQVTLVHDALPELAADDLDTSVGLFGKRLRMPLLIAGMTGGFPGGAEINAALAGFAERRGYAFGLGSQRAMLHDPACAWTYQVRHHAPTTLVLGNLGIVQAAALDSARVQALADEVGADAICIHMNPAQELVQPEGDRDFRGGVGTFRRLVGELRCPVVAKETGCGLSLRAATKLFAAGVRHVDVSGAGGTSWIALESMRAQGVGRALGVALREWGVPTAASIVASRRAGHCTVVATGGIATGIDVARAVALGATLCGVARPAIRALQTSGQEGLDALFDALEQELRAVMLLTGSGTLAALRDAARVVGPDLREWMDAMGASWP